MPINMEQIQRVVNRINDRDFLYNLTTTRGQEVLDNLITESTHYHVQSGTNINPNIALNSGRNIRKRYHISFSKNRRRSRVKSYLYFTNEPETHKIIGFVTCNCNTYRTRYKICEHVLALLKSLEGTLSELDAHNHEVFKFHTIQHSSRSFKFNGGTYSLASHSSFDSTGCETFSNYTQWDTFIDTIRQGQARNPRPAVTATRSQGTASNPRVVSVKDADANTRRAQANQSVKQFIVLSFITDKDRETIHSMIQNFRLTHNLKIKRIRINNAI